MHRSLLAAGLSALTLAAVPGGAGAQSVNAEILLRQLQRPALTRSALAPAAAPQMNQAARDFLRSLPTTRSLAEEDRQELSQIATAYALPQVDVQINFDYNVATPRPDAIPDLVEIGRALLSPALAGQRFVLAGHTDGVGSAAYNLELSQHRANAVRDFLVSTFSIPPERLIAVGFGFERLLNPADPAAAENRRVEVINLEVGWN